ncbi:MAG TPA: HAMP domain-containing sensor histidine kinase, partial [Bryobacteraceae bacterium]|nr:HAMP domain-containing sensor histidine kinase [Bryobacteraceae bacterium]
MKMPGRAQGAWIGQAVLIVLPVAILSGVALHFLREDRAAIEQDAKNRANAIAPEVARQLGDQISAYLADGRKKGLFTQGAIVDGQGRAATDYSHLPQPAAWTDNLPAREAGLWRAAEEARFEHPDAKAAATALTALAQPANSEVVRANAELGLLAAAEPGGDSGSLIRRALRVAQEYPYEVTEAGVQVSDAALFLALRHVKGDLSPDLVSALESQIARQPSFLTVYLLDAAAGAVNSESAKSTVAQLRDKWRAAEDQRQEIRYQMQDFGPRLWRQKTATILYSNRQSPKGSSFEYADVALCVPASTGWAITLFPVEPLRRALRVDVPDYMGAWLNVEGQRWGIRGGWGPKFPPLGYAKASFSFDGAKYPFLLALDLSNAERLYAPYRRRLVMIQWLIFCAVAASLLGLWRLWQTYRDQMRLNEMKSNLVSSVSHELRAPIAAVRLMAESLESGRVDGAEKQKDYYRLIVRGCGRLSSLVENVLDFSRIDQGRKKYHFEPLDAMALLRHTMMLMQPGAAERQVTLRLVEPPAEFADLQPAWDSEAVEQSLVNLIDNAIKHSPADAEVRVEVELRDAA